MNTCKRHTRLLIGKFLFFLFLFCNGNLYAQTQDSLPVQSSRQPQRMRVKILHADEYNPLWRENISTARGNVKLQHEDIVLTCDSLYEYTQNNYVEAFGHVHVVQNDTLNLWGDYLYYNTETRKARVRKNVIMQNPQVTLYTDSLNYDMVLNIGHYFDGGTLKDSVNTLLSEWGYYYVDNDILLFRDSVKVVSPEYTLYSDTLTYHTVTKLITIFGPTHIYGENRYLYSESGWYNSLTSHVELYKNNLMNYNEYKGKADTIVIDSISGTAFLTKNIHLNDTVNNVIVEGEIGEVHRDQDYSYVTERALMILVGQRDSIFIHGDTLSMTKDTAGNSYAKAYYHTKFYNTDLQGLCDSMTFSMKDSTVYMNGNPIVWASDNQMTARFIDMLISNNEVREFHLVEKAMLINQADTGAYNQMKGRTMTGFIENNDLYLIKVNGSGESIYFYDEKGEILMFNATSSFIDIHINMKSIEDVVFISDVEGTLTPFFLLTDENKYLSEFQWHIEKKPLSKEDIFVWD